MYIKPNYLMQFFKRQMKQIQQEGGGILIRKLLLRMNKFFFKIASYIIAIPIVFIMRLIKPFVLLRLEGLISSRIGHFAANTELYLCERDAGINVPNQRYIDIFYMGHKPVCNKQLGIMWKKVLRIWPAWILMPIDLVNRLIPGGKSHEIGQNTQHDRDVHNLFDRFKPHLQFTTEEEARGEAYLLTMGIAMKMPFVCLIVRDSAYLHKHYQGGDFSHHNYRDSDIQNYVLAAETLAERGYFVIRMGVHVHETIKSFHPRIIDYANNGMRSDFMDIYLAAKCHFTISSQTGWDSVPYIFRRPTCYVNVAPVGFLMTFHKNAIFITKHHILKTKRVKLSCAEIFAQGVEQCLFSSEYQSKNIDLIENTPEEICDVVIEMEERLSGTWQPSREDEALQKKFWSIFRANFSNKYNDKLMHGEIQGHFGAVFLRNNLEWLQ